MAPYRAPTGATSSTGSRSIRRRGAAGLAAPTGSAFAAKPPHRELVPQQSSRAPTLAQPRFEEREFTAWLPNRVLLDQLKKESAQGRFPAYVEGRAENYAVEFRAVLRPKPKGFLAWEVRWNVPDEMFEEVHQRLLQRGFILYSRSEFTGFNKDFRHNGVWIKMKD